MSSQWQSKYIEFNNQTHFVRWTGNNLPPLFLIHGFTDSGLYWSRLAADLQENFSVFMPDMLGHGKSSPLSGPITIEQFAANVIALLDKFGIDACHLCGHSMGGLIASTVAAHYPNRVRSLVLEDPAWSIRSMSAPIYLGQFEETMAWRENHKILRQMTHAEALISVTAERESWHPDDIDAYLADRLAYDLSIFDHIDFAAGLEWQNQLQKIQERTLLVLGEVSLGSIVDHDKEQTFLSISKAGQSIRIRGAGHGVHREQYEPFRQAVATFLGHGLN